MIRRLNDSRAPLVAGTFVLGVLLASAATSAHAATPRAAAMPLTKPARPHASARTGGPIKEEIVIAASPDRVYDALLDSTQFAEFTHMPAAIDRKTGGAFTCFNGMIEGRNVELVEDKRIVQAWRAASWPPGVFSIVRFELVPEGAGTRLTMTHSNYEEGEPRASLERGWPAHYWEPLKKYLAPTQ
jgi:uncharacterized protein YndB with AHSA1/START domain